MFTLEGNTQSLFKSFSLLSCEEMPLVTVKPRLSGPQLSGP